MKPCIQILVDNESWIIIYAKRLNQILINEGYDSTFITKITDIKHGDILFLLGCHTILSDKILKKNKHNIVIHESNLPEGKGWSPMTWQIIEGKNRIPICLFEAVKNVDAGKIYLKDEIILNGSELIDGWQKKLGNKTIDLCKKFLLKYPKDIISVNQEKRSSTKYRRRTPKDSEIDINKTLKA